MCRLRGDPLIDTFDANFFQLIGNKKYTLTKHMDPDDSDCSFLVEAKAGKLTGDTTYPRYLDVMVLGVKIRMEQNDKVTVSTLL